jgi:hypothetical protein
MRMHWILAMTLSAVSIGALTAPKPAQAADDVFSNSYVSIGGGVSEITERVDRPFFFNSSSGTGGSLGANARFNLVPGLILDLDYARDQASIGDLDVTRQEGDVSIGYLGAMGQFSSWYVEGVYEHVQFARSSPSICGGDCLTELHDGGGVKAGFIWPVGPQWYFNLAGGYIGLGAHNGYDGLGEPFVNASVGFKVNPALSIGIRSEYAAYIDRNDTSVEEDFASWRAFVSYHF